MKIMKSVEKEMKMLLEKEGIPYKGANGVAFHNSISDFYDYFIDNVCWDGISFSLVISENFIRTFKHKVDWQSIFNHQKLSTKFIREFKNRAPLYWAHICENQKLSEAFIREFQKRVDWDAVSKYQKLSESFIREFKDRVDWYAISKYQKLSGSLIREFKDKLDLMEVSSNQRLSKSLIKEFRENIRVDDQIKNFKEKSDRQKLKEVKAYAKKHNLEFDGTYLYAYREHDKWGRGVWNKAIFYDKIGKEYRDWHCNMNSNYLASFGLGIWPKNTNVNVKVKVHYKDWGCEVRDDDCLGKGRVMAFTLLGPIQNAT